MDLNHFQNKQHISSFYISWFSYKERWECFFYNHWIECIPIVLLDYKKRIKNIQQSATTVTTTTITKLNLCIFSDEHNKCIRNCTHGHIALLHFCLSILFLPFSIYLIAVYLNCCHHKHLSELGNIVFKQILNI